jgi:predicted RNase H-like HicB family nuclease
MATRTFTAILHKEGSLWVAECPEVGAFSQGSSVEDALANLREATELYLEEFPLKDCVIPRHSILAIGTLRGALKQASVGIEDFLRSLG